jgi:hypothetical protein
MTTIRLKPQVEVIGKPKRKNRKMKTNSPEAILRLVGKEFVFFIIEVLEVLFSELNYRVNQKLNSLNKSLENLFQCSNTVILYTFFIKKSRGVK